MATPQGLIVELTELVATRLTLGDTLRLARARELCHTLATPGELVTDDASRMSMRAFALALADFLERLLGGSAADPEGALRFLPEAVAALARLQQGERLDISGLRARISALLDEPPAPEPAASGAPSAEPQPARAVASAAPPEACAAAPQRVGSADAAAPAEGAKLFTVWYGTNRKPRDPHNAAAGFGSQREPAGVHLGKCRVVIPKWHRFGSVGSSLWKRLITWRDDRLKVHDTQPLSDDDFWKVLKSLLAMFDPQERQALVYIHGFNVGFEEAAIRAAQIGFDLKFAGVTAFFSWPSRGNLVDYPSDEAAIEASEPAMTDFLCQLARRVAPGPVHIIAHSMGNRGLLRTIQRIAAAVALRGHVQFGQIILAAPDVDADVFCDLAASFATLSQRTTLYASPADRAVWTSQWLHGYARAGLTPPVTVVRGVDTIVIPDFDLDVLGHGYYAEAAGVLHDIFDLLRRGAAPAGRQRLEPMGTPAARYWQMAL